MQIIKMFPTDFKCEPFYGYLERWFVAGSPDKLPPRSFIVPEDDMLEDYRIVAVRNGDGRIRYAEVGAALEKLYGEKLEGRYLDELYNLWFRKIAVENYDAVAQERFPVYEHRTVSTVVKAIGYHKVIVPVGSAQKIDEYITYILPTDQNIETREDWEKLVKETPWL